MSYWRLFSYDEYPRKNEVGSGFVVGSLGLGGYGLFFLLPVGEIVEGVESEL